MPKKVNSIAPAQRSIRSYVKKLVGVVLSLGIGVVLALGFKHTFVSATTTPWAQTNWSGGVGSGTVNSTVTTYSESSGTDATTSVGNLTLAMKAGWYNSGWRYRRKLTLDNTTSNLGVTSETLTDFPILVVLTSSNIDYTNTQDAGQDLRFTDSDGTTLLSYEIEKWDETGTSYVWVKVPQIDINSNTDYIYMYYGNSSASDGQSVSNTWNSNYKGVWHMKETSGVSVSDSTGQNNGTKISEGNPASMIGSAMGNGLTFDAVNDSIHTGNSNGFNSGNLTIEAWVYNPSAGVGSIFTRGTQGQNGFYWVYFVNNNINFQFRSSSSNNATGGPAVSPGSWHHVAVVHNDGVGINFYYDGIKTTVANTNAFVSALNQNTWVGTYAGSSSRYTGNMDELRHSTSVRSDAYIAASYHSGSNDYVIFDSQVSTYLSSGTLTSNIFDSEQLSAWGNITYTSSGSTVVVKVRSSNSSTMSGADAWNTCSAVSSGTDLSSTDCVTDGDRYIQYQVLLSTADQTQTPTFQDISIGFAAYDQTDPSTNASAVSITGVSSGNWTNNEPTLTWSAGADNGGGSGILGYCVSLDEVAVAAASSTLDPELSSGALAGFDDGVSSSACPYIATGNSLNISTISSFALTSNKRYFFSIKAVDIAGNVYSGSSTDYQDLVSFKYDNVAPTNVTYISTPSGNFGNVNDMFFTWPVSGGSSSSDAHSGVIGWQYSLNGTSAWKGPDTQSTLGITYIENDGSINSYTFTEGDDGADIVVGNNTIYFRAVDAAGNYSSSVTGGISYGGAAPAFAGGATVSVTPSISSSNSFALNWPTAAATEGSIASYYYMINTTPPATLATLKGNSTQYIPTTLTSIPAAKLTGAVRGSNTVYVIAVDTEDNYSPSNSISGTFTLNSTNPDAAQNLSASDTSIKSEKIWRVSLAWSTPNYKGTGTLTYIIERSSNNSNWAKVGTTTGLSYTDTAPDSTTYYYRVGVYDTSDESENDPTYTSSIAILPKGAYDTAASLSSGPTVSSITTKKALIEWSTSRVSDSRVQYGTKSGNYFDEEPSKSEQITSHEIWLTNLSPGTKYYYKVKWTDEDGNIGISSEKAFSTDPAPLVTDPKVTNIGISSSTVSFTVKSATKIKIYYGKTTSFGSAEELITATTGSSYSMNLKDLEDGVRYYYKINAFDSEGAEYEGTTLSFQTLPRPQISNVRVQQVKNSAQPSVVVTWQTNTEVTSIATYYPVGNPSAARDEVDVALKAGTHQVIIRGLLPNTRYDLKVSGRDIGGNEAQSAIQTLTTSTDTRPPLISDLKVEGSSVTKASNNAAQANSQLVVAWTTDELATSQVEFAEGTGNAYSQKTQEDSNLTFNHLVVISNLTPSKVYHLRALSKDSGKNLTESIDVVTITPKATENALDLVVTNLKEVFGFIGK